MTIREVLEMAGDRLKGIPEADLAAEVLLAHSLGMNREKLFLESDGTADANSASRCLDLVDRHARGEPVAYLTGLKEFYGLDFFVDRRVLIPRPETELLVDEVLVKSVEIGPGCRILDVGTGSGCIAVTVAKKAPRACVVGSDISGDALQVARVNADRHGVGERVEFMKSDLMASVTGSFDIIVANLPYIGREKFNFVSREAVEYEPEVALFGGPDGLELYRLLCAQIRELARKPRYFLGEFGFLQGEALLAMLYEFFPDAKKEIRSDYASIERFFMIEFPPI